jgi:hypothetical protein
MTQIHREKQLTILQAFMHINHTLRHEISPHFVNQLCLTIVGGACRGGLLSTWHG